jgi:hypothetical protein
MQLKVFHHQCVRGILGTRHSNGISTEALFGDFRGTKPVASLSVTLTLHTLTRKDVLPLHDGGGQLQGRGLVPTLHGKSYMVL